MAARNRLARILSKLDVLPQSLRSRAVTMLMGRVVPYVATSDVQIEELTAERCIASIPNHRQVRNHIGGIHAAAMALLAETATGFVVAVNVPDTHVPVIKTLRVDYRKRLKGAMRVEAWLTQDQRGRIQAEDKGEVTVHVRATDEAGQEPIECEMVWAWIPKQRRG